MLIGFKVALEPFDMGVAFKGQHMGAEPVEEKAVVADDDRAASEIFDRTFQRLQGFDVQIVGRLVEQQHIAARAQQFRHMHAVAFAARQQPDLFLLVGAFEVERAGINSAVHLHVAKLDDLGSARDFFPDVFRRVQRVARLINKRQLHRVAHGDGALVRLFLADDHPEQRRFARAIWPDHTDNRPRWNGEGQIFDQQLVAHGFFQPDDLDHLIAQTFAVGDDDLRRGRAFQHSLARHLVIARNTGLALGLTRLGTRTDPLEFFFQRFLLGFVFARFLLHPLGLLVQPSRIVALVRDATAAVQFQNPRGDIIKEIAVVGDDQDGALIGDQVLLQPSDGFRVQVVGRFVQQQHIGGFKQQLAQRHAATLAARKVFNHGVIGRAAQRVHRDANAGFQLPQIARVDLVLQICHLVGGLVRVVHRQFVIALENRGFIRHAQHDVFFYR